MNNIKTPDPTGSKSGHLNTALNILFVPRWYPSRLDPMPGLFIQRQAEVLAKQNTVLVISVHPDPHCKGNFEVAHSDENSVRVCRVYYKTLMGIPVVSWLINVFRYIRAHHLGYMSCMPFTADIVHGHILTREILFSWYMARKQNRPFIISEHWSRYFPGNGTYKGFFRKYLTGILLKQSGGLIAVSDPLTEAMKACGLVHPNTFIVPNVVDTSRFIPPAQKAFKGKAVILHVSCFDDKSKNISGLLEAVAAISAHRTDFRLILAGEGPDLQSMQNFARRLGLTGGLVEFAGLKQSNDLISLYQDSSFLVQTSRYETFGTVVIEALACGLPVASTRTGVAASVINSSNGIIIQQSSVYEITMALEKMLDNYANFDQYKLHGSVAGQFSAQVVSEKLNRVYREIISAWQKD